MTVIPSEQLRDAATRVFAERSSTFTDEAKAHEVQDYVDTLHAGRRMYASTLESLPEAAFVAQEPINGEENWSAGQVMTHLVTAQGNMLGMAREGLGLEPVAAQEPGDMTAQPTRADVQALLAQLNDSFDTFVANIPADAALDNPIEHPHFGSMSPRAWLMLSTLHEGDHLNQIRALA